MEISDPKQKAYLYSLFYTDDMTRLRQIRVESLTIASSAAKKLTKGARMENNQMIFVKGITKLDSDESSLLKEFFDQRKTGTIEHAEVRGQLEDIFKKIE